MSKEQKEKKSKNDGKSRFSNLKWIIVAILTIIFILLWLGTTTGLTDRIDDFIYKNVEGMRSNFLTVVLIGITELGGIIGLFLVLLVTVIVLCKKNKTKEAAAITLNLVISTITYVILKNIFQRQRPTTGNILIDEVGFSFPSGHTTNNVAFYFLAIYLVCINVKNKKIRNLSCIILAIIPCIIAFSRIYLRVHYPTDVIAGFCLGIVLVILFTTFIWPRIERSKE